MPHSTDSSVPIAVNIDLSRKFSENRKVVNDEFERRYITNMLERHDGNVTRAAVAGSMDRKHLTDMMKKHGITRESLGIE